VCLQFFNYVSYLIGGEVFTLQDIENGVLRGNRKGVAQLLKPFSKTDPRLQVHYSAGPGKLFNLLSFFLFTSLIYW
jgi:hypothetical protein